MAFRRFFVGQTASLLGDQIAALAVPLTALLVLDASPEQVGLLTAMGLVPSLLFGLTAGALVDRQGQRRRAMVWADVTRCVAVLSLPIAYWLDVLTIQQLYVVAFVVGTFDVVFFVAHNALLVTIVKPSEIIPASSLLSGSRATSEVVGLSLGGALISLLTAPIALVLNAASFAFSAVQLSRIAAPENPG